MPKQEKFLEKFWFTRLGAKSMIFNKSCCGDLLFGLELSCCGDLLFGLELISGKILIVKFWHKILSDSQTAEFFEQQYILN